MTKKKKKEVERLKVNVDFICMHGDKITKPTRIVFKGERRDKVIEWVGLSKYVTYMSVNITKKPLCTMNRR
jgi:hypothetical protein